MRTSQFVKICLFILTFGTMGLLHAAADSADAKTKAQFDKVDTWIEGTVSNIDTQKGTFTIHGYKLPFASAHAQMRKEFETKAAGSSTEKRQQLAEEINKQWRGKLMAAQAEKPGPAQDFNLKSPSNGEVVMLDRKSVQDVTFAYQPEEASQKTEPNLLGELVSIDIYDIPSRNSGTPTSSNSLSQLKQGDLVKLGMDSKTNEGFLVIELHPANEAR